MLFQRMMRAAMLDRTLYNEVEGDESLTTEAGIVVVLAALAAGIGSFLSLLIAHATFGWALRGLFGGILSALIGWAIMAFLCYWVGTSFFGGKATFGELLRTLGYARAPAVLLILNFIPVLGYIVSVVVWVWTLVTLVIAVQESLDVEIGPAIIVCLIAWAVFFVVSILLGLIFGLGAFGLALMA